MSDFDCISDTHLAGLLGYNCAKVDVYANELRRRGWTVKFDTLDVSTIEGPQFITTCKITKTHIEELS